MKEHLRVAIADDDGVCREFVAYVLRRLGHEIVCLAENGRELVAACLSEVPDLVITDVRMPDLDGIAAAAEITARQDIPIVLLSGSDLAPRIEPLAHARIIRRAKPVSRLELEEALAEAVLLMEVRVVA
jgi:response regulator NasT